MLLRWANAKEQMKAAHLCCDYQLYDESITRSYYAPCPILLKYNSGDVSLTMGEAGIKRVPVLAL